MTALCPNCKENRHACSRRCPARLTIVNRGIKRQAAHNPSRQARTRRFRSRSQRQPGPTPPTTSEEHFPTLPGPSTSRGGYTVTAQTSGHTLRSPPNYLNDSLACHRLSQPHGRTAPGTAASTSAPAQASAAKASSPRPCERSSRTPDNTTWPRAGHEGILTSFALTLTGLLKLTPDEEALRVIVSCQSNVGGALPHCCKQARQPCSPTRRTHTSQTERSGLSTGRQQSSQVNDTEMPPSAASPIHGHLNKRNHAKRGNIFPPGRRPTWRSTRPFSRPVGKKQQLR